MQPGQAAFGHALNSQVWKLPAKLVTACGVVVFGWRTVEPAHLLLPQHGCCAAKMLTGIEMRLESWQLRRPKRSSFLNCTNSTICSTVLCFCLLSFPFSVARITRSPMNPHLILSTQLHILTDQVCHACRILNRWSFVWRRLTDDFYVVLLFGGSQCKHVWRSSELHTRNKTSTWFSLKSQTIRAQFCRWRTRSQFT